MTTRMTAEEESAGSAREHTPGSLLVTFFGAHGRDLGGWIAVGDLIRLLAALGVDEQPVRSAVSRLKRRGFLVPEPLGGVAGYALSESARELLADGDRRIYATRAPRLADGWVLALFSVPESERQQRHVLRSRLARLGFGVAAPGVWIAPAHLYEETRHDLTRLKLDRYTDLFRAEHLAFEATTESVRRWWDLPALARCHEDFLEVHEPVLTRWNRARGAAALPEAFADHLRALDSWRRLPYLDPGLPPELLPSAWPGLRAARVFQDLDSRLRQSATDFVRTAVSR
ncbi:PaaX family transcriptional regulator [Streptacidiphilus rugosus]|uniref:PaaX family transcriptional regulator n=1 Tax=Streptacidiphilus rugosus TaxID=405783 RepID=UPI001E347292|nr:PaaX family transcriptional regulator C-terminal domain-containing protein [Streptacidiphilus rugosus]